jgi:hypothetical protein
MLGGGGGAATLSACAATWRGLQARKWKGFADLEGGDLASRRRRLSMGQQRCRRSKPGQCSGKEQVVACLGKESGAARWEGSRAAQETASTGSASSSFLETEICVRRKHYLGFFW